MCICMEGRMCLAGMTNDTGNGVGVITNMRHCSFRDRLIARVSSPVDLSRDFNPLPPSDAVRQQKNKYF